MMSEISKLDQVLIVKKIDNETVNLQISDNEMLMSIVGQFDQNLKDFAKLTKTLYFLEETQLLVREVNLTQVFCEAVKFLINKYFLTKIIENEDIILAVKKNTELEASNVKIF